MTNPKNLPAIFFIPHERAILVVKCDFSYSCATADTISTDLRRRAVPVLQLSYLLNDSLLLSSLVGNIHYTVMPPAGVRPMKVSTWEKVVF